MESKQKESKIVRLREQYDLEYQAGKRALEDAAIVASHYYITKRMERMWEHMKRMQEEVGPEEAKKVFLGEQTETPQSHLS